MGTVVPNLVRLRHSDENKTERQFWFNSKEIRSHLTFISVRNLDIAFDVKELDQFTEFCSCGYIANNLSIIRSK